MKHDICSVQPFFSVVVPVYNGVSTLSDLFLSLDNQVFSNFEVIFVNNCSSDGSLTLLMEYCGKIDNAIVVDEKTPGLSYALNRGVTFAKGVYIARIDQDDIADPLWLLKSFNFARKNSECGLFSCGYTPFDAETYVEGKTVCHPSNSSLLYALLAFCSPFSHPGAVFKRSVAILNPYRNVHGEDHDLWCRIAKNYPVSNIEEPLIRYRVRADSMMRTRANLISRGVTLRGFLHFILNYRVCSKAFRAFSLDHLSKYSSISIKRYSLFKFFSFLR